MRPFSIKQMLTYTGGRSIKNQLFRYKNLELFVSNFSAHTQQHHSQKSGVMLRDESGKLPHPVQK